MRFCGPLGPIGQRRNYAQTTVDAYISALREFAGYFKHPPDQLGPEHIREFQLHLIRDRKLAVNTVKQPMAAVQFFFGPRKINDGKSNAHAFGVDDDPDLGPVPRSET